MEADWTIDYYSTNKFSDEPEDFSMTSQESISLPTTQVTDRRPFLETDPVQALIYLTALITAVVVGTFGNIMIIGAHMCYKKLQKGGNEITINLALADLCVTLIADPMCIIGVFKGPMFFDERPILCEVIASFCLTVCFTAFFSLSFKTFVVYMHICQCEHYHKFFNKARIIGMCVSSWVVAFALEMPNFLGWGDHFFDEKNHQCIWDRTASFSYTLFLAFVMVLTPLLLMLMAYIHMFVTICKTKKEVLKYASDSLTAKQLFMKEWKESMRTCRTMIIIVLAFLVCWVPYTVVISMDFANQYPVWVHMWTTFLAHAHSLVNFWIFLAVNKDYRAGFRMFLHLTSCKRKLKHSRPQSNLSKINLFTSQSAIPPNSIENRESNNIKMDMEIITDTTPGIVTDPFSELN